MIPYHGNLTSNSSSNTPRFPTVPDYDVLEQDTVKNLLCKNDWRKWLEDRSFYLTDIKFKIGAESKCWIHAIEYNRSTFNDLEPELIAKVKLKRLCEDFDDGWKHEVV